MFDWCLIDPAPLHFLYRECMTVTQKPCAEGNWHAGRQFHGPFNRIMGIVVHVMDGHLGNGNTGTDELFNTVPAARAGALKGFASSAHYGISQNGEVHQYVKDEDTAYHAGRVRDPSWSLIASYWAKGAYNGVNPNVFTIGIEHEGSADPAFAEKLGLSFTWPPEMMKASSELIAALCAAYRIPIDRDHIVGHHEIYEAKPCPGDLRIVDLLVQMAAQEFRSKHRI